MIGERSEGKTHCVRQRNRIWDLQESEVNEALQKKNFLEVKQLPAWSVLQKPTSENISADSPLFLQIPSLPGKLLMAFLLELAAGQSHPDCVVD